jgi:hypothetical protein
MPKSSAKRVVMTKKVAREWLENRSQAEYRFRVFNPQAKDYCSVLRSFRDAKLKLANVEQIPDLGIKEDFGCFYLWSSDQSSLNTLERWFSKRGLETDWIW